MNHKRLRVEMIPCRNVSEFRWKTQNAFPPGRFMVFELWRKMSKVPFSCVFTIVPIKHTGHLWKLVFKMIGGSFERANDDISFTSSSSASIFKQTDTFVYIEIWTMVNKNFYFSLFFYKIHQPRAQGFVSQDNPTPSQTTHPNIDFMYHI